MNNRTLYRIMGIGATCAAFLISVADFLLEFSPEYGVSREIVEPAWEFMPQWRFSSSIYLCAFLIPFYIPGFWLLYKTLRQSNEKIARLLFILFSYGIIMGSPLIHTVMNLNPLFYQFGLENNLDPIVLENFIQNKLTGIIFPVFISHYVLTWIVAPVILFQFIIRKKSVFKPWVAFINPLVFLLLGMTGLLIFPELFKFIAPGAINKANTLLFLLLTINNWNTK